MIVTEYGGGFPSDPALLEKLPGIGRSTAAAISVFSAGTRAAILDGNVIRVLSRVFGVTGYSGEKRVKDGLWRLAESLLPEKELEAYTQGLMDLGATVCARNRPACHRCPFASCCVAFREDKVKELPVRKPARVLPERQVRMLLLMRGNAVLLEKRPPSGIWGGLFSLPEWAETESDVTDKALEGAVLPFGRVVSHRLLPEFVHTFTHFRLSVTPVLVMLSDVTEKWPDGQYVWHEMANVEKATLPSPVRKLLREAKQFL